MGLVPGPLQIDEVALGPIWPSTVRSCTWSRCGGSWTQQSYNNRGYHDCHHLSRLDHPPRPSSTPHHSYALHARPSYHHTTTVIPSHPILPLSQPSPFPCPHSYVIPIPVGAVASLGMERALMRLMRPQAQAWRASSCSQRGAVALSLHQVREYVSSPSDGFPRSELSDQSAIGKGHPAWSRGYADSSVQKDGAPQGNVEVLEFGTHKTTAAKRFAVGTTAVDVDEIQDIRTVEEIKEKAKEILQQVGEKIDETVEEAQVRQLQEKLVRTEGIGEVVQELYNNKPEDGHTEYQTGTSV